jgi:hypothetical protein
MFSDHYLIQVWVRARLCKLQKGCTRLATASEVGGHHEKAEILLKVALITTNQSKHT